MYRDLNERTISPQIYLTITTFHVRTTNSILKQFVKCTGKARDGDLKVVLNCYCLPLNLPNTVFPLINAPSAYLI